MGDPGASWGDAAEWAASIGGGNHTPRVGSIAWWGTERGDGHGHVAYVEQVSGSNVYIRADNWIETGGRTNAGWIPASSVPLFLHPHDVSTPSGSARWEGVGGSLVQVDVGYNEVWGVNSAGNVYQFAGGGKWAKKGTGFRHVSAGTITSGPQHVYATKTNGAVVRELP
jgi:surface antigen